MSIDTTAVFVYMVLVGSGIFVLWLLVYSMRLHSTTSGNVEIYARSKEEADYWLGKPGRSFTQAEKRLAYELAGGRCESCGARTIEGNASNRHEHVRSLLGARVGHAGHRVPKSYGGGSESPIWLCGKCNWDDRNKVDEHEIPAYTKRYLIESGKLIYVDGRRNGRA